MSRRIAISALILFGVTLVHAAQVEDVGKVISVLGSVQATRSATGTVEKLAFNSPIFLNDRIRTGEDGQAKILLNDDSILKISPLSDLRVTELIAGVAEETTTIKLLKGRVRSVIGKKLGPAVRYEVKTDVAVAGVRGTDFEVWQYSPDDTAVRCFEGLIEVRSSIPGVEGTVMVRPNTFTTVTRGMPPVPIMPIEPEEFLGDKLGLVVGQRDSWGDVVTPRKKTLQREQEQIFLKHDESLILQTNSVDYSENSPAGGFVFELLDLGEQFALTLSDEQALMIEQVLYEELYGDTLDQQVDTYNEPMLGGRDIQLDIITPTP